MTDVGRETNLELGQAKELARAGNKAQAVVAILK